MSPKAWKRAACAISLGIWATACSQATTTHQGGRTVSAASAEGSNTQETYPAWAYSDSKLEPRPDGQKPTTIARDTEPVQYYTNQRVVMVRQPTGYPADEIPEVAVWWTDNGGLHWHKAGYFGRGQSFFPLKVSNDGTYGVRFVGPYQPAATYGPSSPERLYCVDTIAPEVEVRLNPEQARYHVGDAVSIVWRANDPNLMESPVRIAMMMDLSTAQNRAADLQRDLPGEGTLTHVFSRDAAGREAWFRVEAEDRAGNVGIAYSFALQVVDAPLAQHSPMDDIAPIDDEQSDAMIEDVTSLLAGAVEHLEAVIAAAARHVDDMIERGRIAENPLAGVSEWVLAGDHKRSAQAPIFGRDEGSAAANPVIAEGDFADDDATEVAISETSDCDESFPLSYEDKVLTRGVESETVGPMSQDIGELPYATAASRLIADDAELTSEGDAVDAIAFVEDGSADEIETFAVGDDAMSHDASLEVLTKLTAIDFTHGNGLLVPLPATVEQTTPRTALHHPWRALGADRSAAFDSSHIWTLPECQTNAAWHGGFEDRFPVERPTLRDVYHPTRTDPILAGSGADGE